MNKAIKNIGKSLAILVVLTMLSLLFVPAVYAEDEEVIAEDTAESSTDVSLAGDWVKYEPCNELVIGIDDIGKSVIVTKGTGRNPDVVWSMDALGEAGQKAVKDSLKGVPGSGNPKNYEFISGDGASAYGMTVSSSDGKIVFEDPHNWALIYGNGLVRNEVKEGPDTDVKEDTEPDDSEVPGIPDDTGLPEENDPEMQEGILDGPEETPDEYIPEESPEVPGPETDVTEAPETDVTEEPEADVTEEPETDITEETESDMPKDSDKDGDEGRDQEEIPAPPVNSNPKRPDNSADTPARHDSGSGKYEPVYPVVMSAVNKDVSPEYVLSSEPVIEDSAVTDQPEIIAEKPTHILDVQPRTSIPVERALGIGISLVCLALIVVLYSCSEKERKEE